MAMTDKHQILEPLSSMVELALLNFSGDDIKISVKNHGIYTSVSGDGYLPRSVWRRLEGAGREDIYILHDMIKNYIEWFIIGDYNGNYDIYKNIARYAMEGMRKLQDTYKHGNVVLALQFYIVIITKAINDMDLYRLKIKEATFVDRKDKRSNSLSSKESSVKEEDMHGDITDGESLGDFHNAKDDYTTDTLYINHKIDTHSTDEETKEDTEKVALHVVDGEKSNVEVVPKEVIEHDDRYITSPEILQTWLPVCKEEYISIVDTNKIKQIWSNDDVIQMYAMLKECFDGIVPKSGPFIDVKISGLGTVLFNKDKQFNKIVSNSYGGK